MTDAEQVTSEVVPDPAVPPVAGEAEPAASLASLQKSIRGLRIWLAIITGIVGLAVIAALVGAVGVVTSLASFGEPDTQVDTHIATIEKEIRGAYGDRLQSVTVRAVSTSFEGAPFPYSLFVGSGMDDSIYVEYRLKGSDVTIANTLDSFMGPGELSGSGLVPTKGTIASRMTDEQFANLLVAYAAETDKPLGGVRRYNDRAYLDSVGSSTPDEVLVGDKEYKSKELWYVTEGRIIKGDKIDENDYIAYATNGHVFHEDPKTGVLTYLGTEASDTYY